MLSLITIGLGWIGVAIAYDPVIEQVSPNPAIVGERYSLRCKTGPLGNISQINWSFSNGSTIFKNEIFDLEGNFSEILVFKDVKKTFNGLQFSCFAISFENTTTKSTPFTLTVIESISTIKVRQISPDPAIVGQNYSFLCEVEPSRENVLIHWSFANGSVISDNDVFKLDSNISQTLTINDVKQSYLGFQFICATADVDNSTKKSQPFSLIVVASPEIEYFEDTTYAQSGRPFLKDCLASGYPYPVTKWFQGRKEVRQMNTSVFRSVLVIPTVAPNTRVNYTCKATVSLGIFVLSTKRSFTLISYVADNIGVQDQDESFTNRVEYKYSIFIATIVGVFLLILVLTGILCGYLKMSGYLPGHIKKTEDIGLEPSNPPKDETENMNNGSYVRLKDETGESYLYEDIAQVESTNRTETQKRQQTDKRKKILKTGKGLKKSKSGPSLKCLGKEGPDNGENSIEDQKKLSDGSMFYYEIPIGGTKQKNCEKMKKANNESSLTNNRKKDTETSKYPQKHLPTVPFRDYPKTATDVDGRMTRRKSESFMDNAGKKKPEIIDKSPREQPRVQSAGLNLYDDVPNEKSDEKKTVTVSTVDERMTRSKGQSSIDNAGQEKLETTVKSPREQLGVQLAELHLYDDVPTENTNEKKTVTLINVEERMTRTRSESSMDNAGKKKLGKTDKIPRERTRVQSAELYLYDDVPNENKTVTETTDDQRNSNTTVGSSEHILKRSNETTKQERCRAAKYESYKEAADLYVERL